MPQPNNKKKTPKELNNKDYYSIMERVAKDNWQQWGDESEDAALTRILNANNYDYRGYYNKYPNSRANANTHWTDEFKTVFHPTFSNESKYSNKISKFNPKGVTGGIWSGNNFIPNITQINYINNLRNMARINSRLACGGRKKLACGGRPKAWLGAVIGAASSLASGLIGSSSAKKQQEEALRQQRNQAIMQQNAQLASVYNSALAGNANLANIDYTDNMIYRCGGRKKARNGRSTRLSSPYITDGGVGIPLGNGLTLLRGATHEDTNETGQTGIGIQVGRHQIEAENGEVAQRRNKELRIFSNQPMFNGVSPADAVQAGYNPDEIFAAQEVYKRILGIKDDGSSYKCGGRKKAAGGLLDYYDDVQENDATRTWASSYNGRRRATYYGADNNGAYFDPVSMAFGEIVEPILESIGNSIDPVGSDYEEAVNSIINNPNTTDAQKEVSLAILNAGIGNSEVRIGSFGRRMMRANSPRPRQYRNLNEVRKARQNIQKQNTQSSAKTTSSTITPDFNPREYASNYMRSRQQGSGYRINEQGQLEVTNSGYIPGGTRKQASPRSGVNANTTRPTNIPYEQRLVPYNNSIGNRTRSAVHRASTRLSRALDDIVHNYRVRKRAGNINKARQQKENTSTNSAEQTKWQKRWQNTKRKSLKGLKGAAAVGAGIGAITAIRTLTDSEDINTNGTATSTSNRNSQARRNQQGSTQGNQQSTPTSSRNVRDVIRENNEAINRDYLTPEQRSLIYSPIRVNSNSSNNNRRNRKNNTRKNSQTRLRDITRFTAPTSETRKATQRNIDTSNLTPEQIDKIKEEITQIPSDRRLTRDESIRLTGILNRIDYLNSKRNRSKKRFGGSSITTPVERIGRRKYPNGGSAYTGYSFKFAPNSYGGESPQLITEEPLKIWQRYTPAYNNPGSIASGITQGITPQSIPSKSGNNYLTNPYWGNNRSGLMIKDADWIGLGTDILGSLGIGLINNSALRDINYDYTLPQYIDETPVAFDTTWHNGAQRANVERNRINARNIIGRNTASANAAVQRMQESDTNAMMQQNVLWDEKANKEAELRNTAAQNEQQVRARNAAARNAYYQQIANIRNREIDQNNAIKAQRGQAWASSLAGLGQAASNFLAQAGQRYEDNQALRALSASRGAIMPSMLRAGVDFDNNTIAGLIWNAQQGLNQNLVKPNRNDYGSDDAYSTALKDYENRIKQREQNQNLVNLGTSILGSRGRNGRRYLRSLGLY